MITGLELASQSQTDIYPNPAVDKVTLKVERGVSQYASVQVHSLNGSLIQSKNLLFDEHGEAQLDMSSLSSGIYWVAVNIHGEITKIMRIARK